MSLVSLFLSSSSSVCPSPTNARFAGHQTRPSLAAPGLTVSSTSYAIQLRHTASKFMENLSIEGWSWYGVLSARFPRAVLSFTFSSRPQLQQPRCVSAKKYRSSSRMKDFSPRNRRQPTATPTTTSRRKTRTDGRRGGRGGRGETTATFRPTELDGDDDDETARAAGFQIERTAE